MAGSDTDVGEHAGEGSDMTLYQETPCEHGLLNEHDWYTSRPLQADSALVGYFPGLCPGGSREEVTIDYKEFHKALYEWYHSERPMSSDIERQLVDTALGINLVRPIA